MDTRTLTTLGGRRVRFLGRLDKPMCPTHKEALALVPQGSVSEVINEGMVKIDAVLPELPLILQVHDEVVGQCKPTDLKYCVKMLHKIFNIPITFEGKSIVIPIECKSGPSYGELKEIE